MYKIKMINLNTVAKKISQHEGLKRSTDISQIKEIMRILFNKFSFWELVQMYLKYKIMKVNEIRKFFS